MVESVGKIQDQRRPAGEVLLKRTRELLQHDELAQPLAENLRRILNDAAKLLADTPPPTVIAATPTVVAPTAIPVGQASPAPTATLPLVTSASGTTAASSGAESTRSAVNVAAWAGSDDAEVVAFYRGEPDKIERNRQLVRALKRLYASSQVAGDSTPKGVPEVQLIEVLEVHHIVPLSLGGADERHNMIVVTPTLHALIHSDPACTIELKTGRVRLFGCEFPTRVLPAHNGCVCPC